jgi:hypothetical protein
MLIVALVVTQTAGCAHTGTANSGAGTSIPNITNSDLNTRQPDPKIDIRLAGNEVLVFGRLEVTRTGATPITDLWYDSALFLTADDAPTQPIPRWPAKSLKRASAPLILQDGRLNSLLPPESTICRSSIRTPSCWLAIVRP